MRTRRPAIPQRRRFFLGCEGQSERSYGTLLQRLAESVQIHIHIELHDLHGGDPLAIVESAALRLAKQVSIRGSFVSQAVLLDRDKYGQNQVRDAKVARLAEKHNLLLIWQDPCHEGFLLRHLPGCQHHRPLTAAAAATSLRRYWHDYQKPLNANRLALRIGLAELALASGVESGIASFLVGVGFPVSPMPDSGPPSAHGNEKDDWFGLNRDSA